MKANDFSRQAANLAFRLAILAFFGGLVVLAVGSVVTA